MPPGAVDIPSGPPPVVGHMPGHHGHPGPRRRGPPPHVHGHAHGGPPPHIPQYAPQYHQQMNAPMYPGYVPYGAPQQYYGMPPQYPNGGIPAQGYMPYPNYPRSPPSVHGYGPPMGVGGPPSYSRPQPQSPALSTPYQPPPATMSAPIPPHTPSSTHSSQMISVQTPPTPQTVAPQSVQESSPAPPIVKKPFRAPVSSAWPF